MKKAFIKLYYFFKSKSFLKYLICSIILSASFFFIGLLLYTIYHENVFQTIFATAFGFAITNIIIVVLGTLGRYFEDRMKVNTSTDDMLKIYTSPEYKKSVSLDNSETALCYHPVVINDGYDFAVKDDEEKMYHPYDFISGNLVALFEAHSSSSKNNELTIRLDDVVKETDGETGKTVYTFYLSRSTFFNHLISNRAVDYQITSGLSIRSIYEYGPEITPLGKSTLSNHIGINALVYLEDGTLLLPQRSKTSTISKNCLTASIATRLTFPGGKPSAITKEYLFEDCIYSYLSSRLSVDVKNLGRENVRIDFLGVGQNIYEGGKPQMYFRVDLKGVNADNYRSRCLKAAVGKSKIDVDKKILIAEPGKISPAGKEGRFWVTYLDEKSGCAEEKLFDFERSMLCNIWHAQQREKKDLVIIDGGSVAEYVLLPWLKKKYPGKEKNAGAAELFRRVNGLSLEEIAGEVGELFKVKPKKLIKEWTRIAALAPETIGKIRNLKKHSEVVFAADASEGFVEEIFRRNGLSDLFDRVCLTYKYRYSGPMAGFCGQIIENYDRNFEKVTVCSNTIDPKDPAEVLPDGVVLTTLDNLSPQ